MGLGRERVYAYGVDYGEIQEFVNGNDLVKGFLGRYKAASTVVNYSRVLAWFFKWLRIEKRIVMGPEELLNDHVRRRSLQDIRERSFVLRLVLDFCRDNPDFRKCGDVYRRGLFNVVKTFFSYYNADLTSANVWNARCCNKFSIRQLSVDLARKYLVLFGQREKTVCLVMIQSGMSIGDLLSKFNFMLDYVKAELDVGKNRIKVDFQGRKGNNMDYFTFIGADGCQELRVWLKTREDWLRELGKTSNAIFITRTGATLTKEKFECIFYQKTCRLGLKKEGAFSFRSHMFRRMFKTESSPPERGVNGDYAEFMLGHRGGIQSVGGTYDRTPQINPGIVEKEYAKLEPYLNVYSGRAGDSQFSDEDKQNLELLKTPGFKEWLWQKFKAESGGK